MKYFGLFLALCLLAFIVSDIRYVLSAGPKFEDADAMRHLQFQVTGLVLIVWHCGLTWRARNIAVHGKLVFAFICLVALVISFFLLLPLYRHESQEVSEQLFILLPIFPAVGLMFWAWRKSSA